MFSKYFIQILIFAMVLFGLTASAFFSYQTFVGSTAYTSIGFLPLCFVMTQGYLLMMIDMLLPNIMTNHSFFYVGAMVVFSITFANVVAEQLLGYICFMSIQNSLPCIAFLLLIITIIVLDRVYHKMKIVLLHHQK
jgi:hypothetical protein